MLPSAAPARAMGRPEANPLAIRPPGWSKPGADVAGARGGLGSRRSEKSTAARIRAPRASRRRRCGSSWTRPNALGRRGMPLRRRAQCLSRWWRERGLGAASSVIVGTSRLTVGAPRTIRTAGATPKATLGRRHAREPSNARGLRGSERGESRSELGHALEALARVLREALRDDLVELGRRVRQLVSDRRVGLGRLVRTRPSPRSGTEGAPVTARRGRRRATRCPCGRRRRAGPHLLRRHVKRRAEDLVRSSRRLALVEPGFVFEMPKSRHHDAARPQATREKRFPA